MLADHIVMSSGCVCTAIKPGSTSTYMCKTHFPEQQGQGMKGKVRKMQSILKSIQTQEKKISGSDSNCFSVLSLRDRLLQICDT